MLSVPTVGEEPLRNQASAIFNYSSMAVCKTLEYHSSFAAPFHDHLTIYMFPDSSTNIFWHVHSDGVCFMLWHTTND